MEWVVVVPAKEFGGVFPKKISGVSPDKTTIDIFKKLREHKNEIPEYYGYFVLTIDTLESLIKKFWLFDKSVPNKIEVGVSYVTLYGLREIDSKITNEFLSALGGKSWSVKWDKDGLIFTILLYSTAEGVE